MISTIVTTRTSTQIRKHAKMKNNAEALRKHRESLSSDTKAHIQESNTAAHQKCRNRCHLIR